MNKENSADKYAIISGACFAALAVWDIILRIQSVIEASNKDYFYDLYGCSPFELFFPVERIASLIVLIGFAVFAIMRKKNIGLASVAGIYVLLHIYFLVKFFSVCNIFDVLSAIALMFIISFVCIPSISLTSKVGIVKEVWFAPAVLCALGNISYIIDFCQWLELKVSELVDFTWISTDLLEIASIFFIALWLESSIDLSVLVKKKKTAPKRIAIGGADILLEYKELLDNGIITQEEFDSKKKQIL